MSQLSLEELKDLLHTFADDRDWHQFHTPRNLVLALTGEVGELAEIFQWKGELQPGLPEFSSEEKEHLAEELADVLMYLVRLADRSGIDLSKAVLDKLEKNKRKYPANIVRGSSKKYDEYEKAE